MGHPLASTENARHALLYMCRIRKFEEAVEDLFGRGMMHGTMHLSIGQEASPTGMCMALTIQDQITSTHRGHGHCIAKGADLTRMIAELLGKEKKPSKNAVYFLSAYMSATQGQGIKLDLRTVDPTSAFFCTEILE
jgi:TPP-dependent pyruvate/acetoin dehydrogenase alpha subunit